MYDNFSWTAVQHVVQQVHSEWAKWSLILTTPVISLADRCTGWSGDKPHSSISSYMPVDPWIMPTPCQHWHKSLTAWASLTCGWAAEQEQPLPVQS